MSESLDKCRMISPFVNGINNDDEWIWVVEQSKRFEDVPLEVILQRGGMTPVHCFHNFRYRLGIDTTEFVSQRLDYRLGARRLGRKGTQED